MPDYFLAKHAFVCAIGSDVIVLDLRHDKYLAFEREFWEPIGRSIGGWSSAERGHSSFSTRTPCAEKMRNVPILHPPTSHPDENALKQLLECGLLTQQRDDGKDATPAAIDLPSISLIEDFRIEPPRIRAGHVLAFLHAVFAAMFRLKVQSIEKVVRRTRRRRFAADHVLSEDRARLRDLTEIFRRLRPLLFSSRNHCLFESLALFNFLAHYDIYPTWVFGVTTVPFAAHCWLQLDTIACNDPLDQIRRYTPIMVV